MKTTTDPNTTRDTNPDPITGAPGAHPVGVGVGTAGAGAAGAGIGAAIGGPVGAVVGAVVGGIAGGLAGKSVAEAIDPTAENAYWEKEHGNQDYARTTGRPFNDFEPAYRTGYEGHRPGARFEDESARLEREYESRRGTSNLTWQEARPAAERAWTRVERGEAVRRPAGQI